MRQRHTLWLGLLLAAWAGMAGFSQQPVSPAQTDARAQGFINPPNSAKPRVWWPK